jgi:hypothetical protein
MPFSVYETGVLGHSPNSRGSTCQVCALVPQGQIKGQELVKNKKKEGLLCITGTPQEEAI